MRDVEELLRDTVADTRRRLDPPPAFYEGVRRRATERRRRQFAVGGAALAVVAVAAVATTLAVSRPARQPVAPAGPAPTSVDPRHGTEGAPVEIGDKWYAAMDTIATSSGLYILTTDVTKLDAAGDHLVATAAGPAGTPSGMAIDGEQLWVWSQNLGQVRLYDAKSLHVLATFNSGLQFFSAAAIDGELWIASEEGLYVLPSATRDWSAATKVIDGQTYSVAADPARHRVLVGTMVATTPASKGLDGTAVSAVDARTHAVTTAGPILNLGKTGLAVVGGQVWIGGFTSGDERRIDHLDATTLQAVGSSPVNDRVGPGAILWPGKNVLWVRSGGDEGLFCVDPKSGDILEEWLTVQGPVSSVEGRAYAVVGNLVRLQLNAACTG